MIDDIQSFHSKKNNIQQSLLFLMLVFSNFLSGRLSILAPLRTVTFNRIFMVKYPVYKPKLSLLSLFLTIKKQQKRRKKVVRVKKHDTFPT